MFSTLELEFTKENETTISIKVPEVIVNYIDDIINTLSLGKTSDFDGYLTNELEDKLVSRIIAAIFFNKYRPTMSNSYGFLLVYAYYKDRIVLVSLGELPINQNDKVIVNGVLYE